MEDFDIEDWRASARLKYKGNDDAEDELTKEVRRGNKERGTKILGKKNATMVDVPMGMAQQVMPLPYTCPHCGTTRYNYVFKCWCGRPTPLGNVNWRR